MDTEEIKKKLAEMQKKLQPIEKGETTIKAEEQPVPAKKPPKPPAPKPAEVPEPEPVPTGTPCLYVEFKDLIMNLNPSYIGQNAAKNMLIEILGTIPDCPSKEKVAV